MDIFNNFLYDDYVLLYKVLIVILYAYGTTLLAFSKKHEPYFYFSDKLFLITSLIILTLITGTRGINIGTDTINYYNFYFLKTFRINTIQEFFDILDTDFLFKCLMFITFKAKSYQFFLFCVAALINITLYFSFRKFTNNSKNGSSFILFLTFASTFSFLNLEINIIRNAIAICFILLGTFYLIDKQNYRAAGLFIIAFLFHSTSIIPIIAIVTAVLLNEVSLKYFLALYLITIVLAYFGFGLNSIPFLQGYESENLQRLFFEGETKYRIGFRPDFVVYNSFFLFLFIKLVTNKQKIHLLLLKYYIITSIVFFLNFNVPFSDRIGLYSWIAIPFLLFSTIKNNNFDNQVVITGLAGFLFFALNHFILFP